MVSLGLVDHQVMTGSPYTRRLLVGPKGATLSLLPMKLATFSDCSTTGIEMWKTSCIILGCSKLQYIAEQQMASN